jgi:hypothetical protein
MQGLAQFILCKEGKKEKHPKAPKTLGTIVGKWAILIRNGCDRKVNHPRRAIQSEFNRLHSFSGHLHFSHPQWFFFFTLGDKEGR